MYAEQPTDVFEYDSCRYVCGGLMMQKLCLSDRVCIA
jgi:hypothetical protein